MAVTLQNALAHNQALLGADYGLLGKNNRTYLSYDRHAGWSVVKFEGCFGFIKQIFRMLGFYPWTSLKNVFQQIQREVNVPPALLAKIGACWQRQGHQMAPRPVQAPVAPNRVGFNVGATRVSIEQGDLTQVQGIAAIVNAANPPCLGGDGIDGAIHRAAGPDLLAACRALPEIRPDVRCEIGGAVITPSGNLAQRGIQRIIHTVGPHYNPADPRASAAVLRQSYISCLDLAHQNGIRTIGIPAISTGIYGYPFGDATQVAIETVANYAHRNPGRFDEIRLDFMGAPQAREAAQILNILLHPHAV